MTLAKLGSSRSHERGERHRRTGLGSTARSQACVCNFSPRPRRRVADRDGPLGHSTIRLTADTYGHVLSSRARHAADALDRLMDRPKGS